MEQIKKHILHLLRDSGLGKYEAQFEDVLKYYSIPDKGVLSFFYTAHPDAMYALL